MKNFVNFVNIKFFFKLFKYLKQERDMIIFLFQERYVSWGMKDGLEEYKIMSRENMIFYILVNIQFNEKG